MRPLPKATGLALVVLVALGGLVALLGARPLPGVEALLDIRRVVTGSVVYAEGGDLVVAAPDGRGPRRLTAGSMEDRDPVWSPDGTQIAYLSARLDPNAQGHRFLDVGLWVIGADGSGAREVLAFEEPQAPWYLTWTPDGRAVTFTEPDGGLLVVDVTDGRSREMPLPDGLFPHEPQWSPDGAMIAFKGMRDLGGERVDQRVYVIDRDGRAVTPISRFVDTAPRIGFEIGAVNWTPDSSALVYSYPRATRITEGGSDMDGQDMVIARRTGGAWHEAPLFGSGPPDPWELRAALSHRGDRVAFLRMSLDGEALWVANVDASNTREVGAGFFVLGNPCWTPDDSRIAALVQIGADGGKQVLRVFDPSGAQQPFDLPFMAPLGMPSCGVWQAREG